MGGGCVEGASGRKERARFIRLEKRRMGRDGIKLSLLVGIRPHKTDISR